jgi:hypothetical protein
LDFVVALAGLDEGQRGGIHLVALVPHTPAVVHHQAQGDGDVFAAEYGELLLDLVFKDAEVILFQIGDQALVGIHHTGQQHHQVDVPRDAKGLILLWLRRRSSGGLHIEK